MLKIQSLTVNVGGLMLNILMVVSIIFCESKDYKSLFEDTTYKNYWARFYTLLKLCKEPDKNYKTLLLAYEHKEEAISELATDCLSRLQDKKNIDDFIKKYIDGNKGSKNIRSSITILSRLSKDELIKRLDKFSDKIKSFALETFTEEEVDRRLIEKVKKFLGSKSDEVKISALKMLIKANGITTDEDINRFLNSSNKMVKFHAERALCLLNKERCIEVLHSKINTKDNMELCNLIYILMEYGIQEVYEELLKKVDNMKDFFKKKVIFSGLSLLEDIRFKEVVLKYWRELSMNFLSLLFNVYIKKFDEDFENISVEGVYKRIKKIGDESGFRTVGVPMFFTLPVYGRSIVFVIDMSGSMTKRVGDSEVTRFELARKELEKVLNGLGPNIKFNIVLINSETDKLKIRQFSNNLVSANKEQINKALNYLDSAWEKLQKVKRGRSDIYDALDIAMNVSGVDTVIVLTDGNPTWGRYTLRDNILREISLQNRCKFVSINTVAAGAGREGRDFLRKLSLENFGVFKEVKWEK